MTPPILNPATSTAGASAAPLNLRLAASYTLEGERRERESTERWLRAGDGERTFEYLSRSERETRLRLSAAGTFAPPPESGRREPRTEPAAFFTPSGPGEVAKRGLRLDGRTAAQPLFRERGPAPEEMIPERGKKRQAARDEKCDGGTASLSPRDQALLFILEKFFGLRVRKEAAPRELEEARERAEKSAAEIRAVYQGRGAAGAPATADWWVDAGVRRTTAVREEVEFEIKLTAQVRDGQGRLSSQEVNVRVRASREFVEETEARLRLGRQKDPLVLDLTGQGIDLRGLENGTLFDLDADGSLNRTAVLDGGSGLLWLDRNANGRLDDGRELFGDFDGARDGFDSLARLDSNRDGRIDAQDEAYAELRLRSRTGDRSLAEAEVAGIYLQNQACPASLGGSGAMQSLGVFERTDGTLGAVADMRLAYEV